MSTVHRRALLKGTVWVAPVMSLAQAAPAMAASCVPRSDTNTAALEWQSTQLEFTGADVEKHVVEYTVINRGPDPLPAEAQITVHLSYEMYEGTDSSVSVAVTSGEVAGQATASAPVDLGDGTGYYEFDVVVTVDQQVPAGNEFTFEITALYGALTTPVTETVESASPLTQTSVDGCLTTTTVISIHGASDGTSYES